MKRLIIQSDDLGISKAVSLGIAEGVKAGMVKCTGLFANMPYAKECYELVKDYENLCVGIDINIVCGKPVAPAHLLDSMVDENGCFFTSTKSRMLDKECSSGDHLVYEQCYIEAEAQINQFFEITGKYPEYLHGHSYSTPTLNRAVDSLAEKYHIPTTRYLLEHFNIAKPQDWNKKPFPLQEQLMAKQLDAIINSVFINNEIGRIIFHCGYVDAELFDLTTYTLIRTKDLQTCLSAEFQAWIAKNKIELISYRELIR